MEINHQTGLVLEGGGMRGVFTSGVLDALMKHAIYFRYVVAVSAARSLRCCAHSSFSVTPEGTVLKSMVAMSGSCLSCHNRERPKARNQRGSSHYQGAGAKYPHCQRG